MRPGSTEPVAWSVGRSITLTGPAKTAEPIDVPFGIWTPEGPGKHVVDGMHIDDNWRILLNRPREVAMRPFGNYCNHLFEIFCYRYEFYAIHNIQRTLKSSGVSV